MLDFYYTSAPCPDANASFFGSGSSFFTKKLVQVTEAGTTLSSFNR